MQSLTFEMMGARPPIDLLDAEDIRLRLNNIGYLDPSIIIRTDNTVALNIDKNIYTITSNLIIDSEQLIIDGSTIVLSKDNFGIQELLVNVETSDDPGYIELINYTFDNRNITLDTDEYDSKEVFIKYLTIR